MKSGNLNFLEPSGTLQACKGTALSLFVVIIYSANICLLCYMLSVSFISTKNSQFVGEEVCVTYYNTAKGAIALYHVIHNSHHHGLTPCTLHLCVSRTNPPLLPDPLHGQPTDTRAVPARTNQDEFPLVNCFPLSFSAWLQSRLYLRNPSKLYLSY